MLRFRAIPNWPSSTRLLWLFLAAGWLFTFVMFGRSWLTFTVDTPAGPAEGNLVGPAAALVALGGLVALSWSEQRWPRALLEALFVATGWAIPILMDNLRRSEPTEVLVDSFCICLVLCAAVRLIALAIVRKFVLRLVVSPGPLCGRCGHDLTGNLSSVCPACGTADLDADTAPESPEATAQAESRGQYRRPAGLIAAVGLLGILMAWTGFSGLRSGYDLGRIGRDLILFAILAALLATIYVRQRKA